MSKHHYDNQSNRSLSQIKRRFREYMERQEHPLSSHSGRHGNKQSTAYVRGLPESLHLEWQTTQFGALSYQSHASATLSVIPSTQVLEQSLPQPLLRVRVGESGGKLEPGTKQVDAILPSSLETVRALQDLKRQARTLKGTAVLGAGAGAESENEVELRAEAVSLLNWSLDETALFDLIQNQLQVGTQKLKQKFEPKLNQKFISQLINKAIAQSRPYWYLSTRFEHCQKNPLPLMRFYEKAYGQPHASYQNMYLLEISASELKTLNQGLKIAYVPGVKYNALTLGWQYFTYSIHHYEYLLAQRHRLGELSKDTETILKAQIIEQHDLVQMFEQLSNAYPLLYQIEKTEVLDAEEAAVANAAGVTAAKSAASQESNMSSAKQDDNLAALECGENQDFKSGTSQSGKVSQLRQMEQHAFKERFSQLQKQVSASCNTIAGMAWFLGQEQNSLVECLTEQLLRQGLCTEYQTMDAFEAYQCELGSFTRFECLAGVVYAEYYQPLSAAKLKAWFAQKQAKVELYLEQELTANFRQSLQQQIKQQAQRCEQDYHAALHFLNFLDPKFQPLPLKVCQKILKSQVQPEDQPYVFAPQFEVKSELVADLALMYQQNSGAFKQWAKLSTCSGAVAQLYVQCKKMAYELINFLKACGVERCRMALLGWHSAQQECLEYLSQRLPHLTSHFNLKNEQRVGLTYDLKSTFIPQLSLVSKTDTETETLSKVDKLETDTETDIETASKVDKLESESTVAWLRQSKTEAKQRVQVCNCILDAVGACLELHALWPETNCSGRSSKTAHKLPLALIYLDVETLKEFSQDLQRVVNEKAILKVLQQYLYPNLVEHFAQLPKQQILNELLSLISLEISVDKLVDTQFNEVFMQLLQQEDNLLQQHFMSVLISRVLSLPVHKITLQPGKSCDQFPRLLLQGLHLLTSLHGVTKGHFPLRFKQLRVSLGPENQHVALSSQASPQAYSSQAGLTEVLWQQLQANLESWHIQDVPEILKQCRQFASPNAQGIEQALALLKLAQLGLNFDPMHTAWSDLIKAQMFLYECRKLTKLQRGSKEATAPHLSVDPHLHEGSASVLSLWSDELKRPFTLPHGMLYSKLPILDNSNLAAVMQQPLASSMLYAMVCLYFRLLQLQGKIVCVQFKHTELEKIKLLLQISDVQRRYPGKVDFSALCEALDLPCLHQAQSPKQSPALSQSLSQSQTQAQMASKKSASLEKMQQQLEQNLLQQVGISAAECGLQDLHFGTLLDVLSSLSDDLRDSLFRKLSENWSQHLTNLSLVSYQFICTHLNNCELLYAKATQDGLNLYYSLEHSLAKHQRLYDYYAKHIHPACARQAGKAQAQRKTRVFRPSSLQELSLESYVWTRVEQQRRFLEQLNSFTQLQQPAQSNLKASLHQSAAAATRTGLPVEPAKAALDSAMPDPVRYLEKTQWHSLQHKPPLQRLQLHDHYSGSVDLYLAKAVHTMLTAISSQLLDLQHNLKLPVAAESLLPSFELLLFTLQALEEQQAMFNLCPNCGRRHLEFNSSLLSHPVKLQCRFCGTFLDGL